MWLQHQKLKTFLVNFRQAHPKNPHFQRKIAPIIVFTSSQSPPGPSAIATISSSCSLSFILLPATKVIDSSSIIGNSSIIMLISDRIWAFSRILSQVLCRFFCCLQLRLSGSYFFFQFYFSRQSWKNRKHLRIQEGASQGFFIFFFLEGGDSVLSQLRRYFGVSLQFQRHSSVTRKSFCEFGRYFFFFLLFLLSSRAKLTSFFVIVHFEINESFLCAPLLSCLLRLLNCLIFSPPLLAVLVLFASCACFCCFNWYLCCCR